MIIRNDKGEVMAALSGRDSPVFDSEEAVILPRPSTEYALPLKLGSRKWLLKAIMCL